MLNAEKIQRKSVEIKNVVCSAIATDDGYYKGRIVKTGEKFRYEGITKNGKLPLWVKAVGKIEEVKAPKAKKAKVEEVEEEIEDEAQVSDLI